MAPCPQCKHDPFSQTLILLISILIALLFGGLGGFGIGVVASPHPATQTVVAQAAQPSLSQPTTNPIIPVIAVQHMPSIHDLNATERARVHYWESAAMLARTAKQTVDNALYLVNFDLGQKNQAQAVQEANQDLIFVRMLSNSNSPPSIPPIPQDATDPAAHLASTFITADRGMDNLYNCAQNNGDPSAPVCQDYHAQISQADHGFQSFLDNATAALGA